MFESSKWRTYSNFELAIVVGLIAKGMEIRKGRAGDIISGNK